MLIYEAGVANCFLCNVKEARKYRSPVAGYDGATFKRSFPPDTQIKDLEAVQESLLGPFMINSQVFVEKMNSETKRFQ